MEDKELEKIIERVEREIETQKNECDGVLINVDDLNKLGYNIDKNKKGKVWVDPVYLKIVLDKYRFKESLKVPLTDDFRTFRELEEEIKRIERGEN